MSNETTEPLASEEISDESWLDADTKQLYTNLFGEAPEGVYHSLFEVIGAVLSNIHLEASTRITPEWAVRIVNTYHGVTLQQTPQFKETWLKKMVFMERVYKEILQKAGPDALLVTSPEHDLEVNEDSYKRLLFVWNKQLHQWNLDWNAVKSTAGVELAAINETRNFFFGQAGGVNAWFNTIGLNLTSDEEEAMIAELAAMEPTK